MKVPKKKETLISPQYPASKLTKGDINDWIDIYEDRVYNWIFKHAHFLLSNKYYHYAVTCLLMPYFESITMYLKGKDSKNHSQDFFKVGFVSVFKHLGYSEDFLKRVASVLYKHARCGFFHDNMIRSKIYFHESNKILLVPIPSKNDEPDFTGEIHAIIISPRLLLNELENHFNKYIKILRNKSDSVKLKNFEKIWIEKNIKGFSKKEYDVVQYFEPK